MVSFPFELIKCWWSSLFLGAVSLGASICVYVVFKSPPMTYLFHWLWTKFPYRSFFIAYLGEQFNAVINTSYIFVLTFTNMTCISTVWYFISCWRNNCTYSSWPIMWVDYMVGFKSFNCVCCTDLRYETYINFVYIRKCFQFLSILVLRY